MKIIILAAGIGSRLKGEGSPKALTVLSAGQTILEFQLEQLSRYCNLDHVAIVVGYKQEQIRHAFPQLSYIENTNYAAENTSKSLLKALRGVDDDVLWLNGDVLFHHRILQPMLERRHSCMVVNQAPVGDEEVKYRTDGAGRILQVSKQVKHGEGEAVGINFFEQADIDLLRQALEQCVDSDYFEKAIETCIQKGLKVWTVPIAKTDCIEVDFPEDLEAANVLIQSW